MKYNKEVLQRVHSSSRRGRIVIAIEWGILASLVSALVYGAGAYFVGFGADLRSPLQPWVVFLVFFGIGFLFGCLFGLASERSVFAWKIWPPSAEQVEAYNREQREEKKLDLLVEMDWNQKFIYEKLDEVSALQQKNTSLKSEFDKLS